MQSSLTRVVRRSVRAGSNIVSQVIVSVAAAVCVGFITNAYFEQQPASTEPAAEQATTFPAAKTPIRIVDEGTYNTAGAGQPPRPLAPIAVASPIRNVAETPMPVRASPAETLAGASLPALPSQIIADLPVRDIDQAAEGAEIFPGVPAESTLAESLRNAVPAAEQRPERRHFLGLPLPYFVPTASDLVDSASAAGGTIVSLLEGR